MYFLDPPSTPKLEEKDQVSSELSTVWKARQLSSCSLELQLGGINWETNEPLRKRFCIQLLFWPITVQRSCLKGLHRALPKNGLNQHKSSREPSNTCAPCWEALCKSTAAGAHRPSEWRQLQARLDGFKARGCRAVCAVCELQPKGSGLEWLGMTPARLLFFVHSSLGTS